MEKPAKACKSQRHQLRISRDHDTLEDAPLPEAVKKDIRETKGLNTLQDMILHVQKDLGRLNDSKIAKLHSERLKQSLSQTHRVHAINTEDIEQPTSAQKSEDDIGQFQNMINALSSKIDTIAAAVETKRAQPRSGPHAQRGQRGPGQRGPSDFAKFKGCLHCGGNHLVKDCRAKKELLEENNGKYRRALSQHSTSGKRSNQRRLLLSLMLSSRMTTF